MKSKLYIGNLPYDVEDADIEKLFSESGTVESVSIIKDRDSGRNKGFGFVEMKSPEDASNVIEKFNGFDLKGRAMKVNLARDKRR
ncbi:MAG: RNA-binding protein [Bdellovibrionales bacterium]|nr:RNA-binding protein [Bdellovibrionales bacterium]